MRFNLCIKKKKGPVLEVGITDDEWVGRLRLKRDGTRSETRFRLHRNRRVHLNQWGRQLGRLLAAEAWASAVVMLDAPCSEVA